MQEVPGLNPGAAHQSLEPISPILRLQVAKMRQGSRKGWCAQKPSTRDDKINLDVLLPSPAGGRPRPARPPRVPALRAAGVGGDVSRVGRGEGGDEGTLHGTVVFICWPNVLISFCEAKVDVKIYIAHIFS